MKRREFIILTGIGATGATWLSACGNPERKLIPALIPDEEYVPGIDYWKASACGMCNAGCGIIVRTREHRANKIEGNPAHPVNQGALCARGQAGLQALYNPDRIRGPMRRRGDRFSGEFEEVDWDEAIRTLAERLREVKTKGRAEGVVFVTTEPQGVTGFVAEHLLSAYGTGRFVWAQACHEAPTPLDYQASYGRAVIPVFDIANATYLLSFSARFLETWHSPVMYSLAYGQFRQSRGRPRGRFVQVEPRMSLTGANADEWLPARPGAEGHVALAVAQVLIREGLIKNATMPDFIDEPLDVFAPEKTTDQTDIPAEKIIRIAHEFASSPSPLAIAGSIHPGGARSLKAVSFLNDLVGNIDKPGGVLLSSATYFDPFTKLRPGRAQWAGISSDSLSNVEVLFVHQANPAHTSPWMKDDIREIPFIASFSSFMDETTEMADLILPDHTYLESWDIRSSFPSIEPVVTLMRPVVRPEFNTMQTANALIALSREIGEVPSFESAEEVVRQAASELQKAGGQGGSEGDGDLWERFVESGVWTGRTEASAKREGMPFLFSRGEHPSSELAGDAQDYPFTLLAYEHAALGLGESANLPWLQELPDPLTSVMWGSWVEMNPRTARELGVADGDLVEVQTPGGRVLGPVILYPAIRPDVIAMPYGQGHTAYGRYAQGRGINPALLFSQDQQSTARARVIKVRGEAILSRFGTMLPERPEVER